MAYCISPIVNPVPSSQLLITNYFFFIFANFAFLKSWTISSRYVDSVFELKKILTRVVIFLLKLIDILHRKNYKYVTIFELINRQYSPWFQKWSILTFLFIFIKFTCWNIIEFGTKKARVCTNRNAKNFNHIFFISRVRFNNSPVITNTIICIWFG